MATKEMTKKERREAIKAAKRAEKEAKAAETKTTVENTTVEQPKDEKKKPAEKPAEVKNQQATEKKTEEKKEDPKPAPKKDAPKDKPKEKKDKIPTIIPEDAGEKTLDRAKSLTGQIPTSPNRGGSSFDAKAMLLHSMTTRYYNNEELQKNYPELYNDLNRSMDVITLLAMVDLRQEMIERNASGQLMLKINADQILPLQSMAALLGIELAPAKALPGNDGQMQIDFKESKIPEELTKDAGKNTEEKPELDPKKIQSAEDVKKALEYLLRSDNNTATALVNAVEWYRTMRMTNEEDANKKLAMDDKTVEEWINEIISITNPTSLLRGLGRAVYLYDSQLGSPIFSHSLLHHHISKVGWSEEQIASAHKALIQENVRMKLKEDENAKPQDDKALKAVIGSLGTEYIEKLFNDANINIDEVAEDKKTEMENAKKDAKKILGVIRTNYFEKDHVPTTDELRMCVGQIINLYRDPANRLAEYCQNYITSPKEGEYPEKASGEKKN